MKKWNIIFAMLMVMLLAACGSDDAADGKKSDGEKENESATNDGKVLAEEDFAKMYSNPKKYKNYTLTLTGKIFMTPEKDEDGTYIQMYADPENSEQNVIVAIKDPKLAVSEGDYIAVTGKVKDEFKGENMLGGEVKVPLIEADTIEVVDYITAIAPTLHSIDVQQQQN